MSAGVSIVVSLGVKLSFGLTVRVILSVVI